MIVTPVLKSYSLYHIVYNFSSRKILKRCFVFQIPTDQEFIPIEFDIPMQTESEPDQPLETVEEYLDPQGKKMRRVTKRTVVVRTVNVNGKFERIEEPREEVREEPVADIDRPSGPGVDERISAVQVKKRVELPDWKPVEISKRPRLDEPEELDKPVEENPVKPVFSLRPLKPSSEDFIKPSTVDRSYVLPDFEDGQVTDEKPSKSDEKPSKSDERREISTATFSIKNPKDLAANTRTSEKDNPFKFKIQTVKKNRVGHVEAGPRKSNEFVNLQEPNKV